MKTQRLISLRPDIDLPALHASMRTTLQENPEGRSWYSIRNITRNEAEISIYGEIGGWGVTAADFIRDLADLKAEKISLRINSPGGDVFDGVAIYNAIKRHTAEVTVYVDGLAASAASFIAMAGERVLMSRHSQMMIHDAVGFVMGNAGDMRKLADILDSISNSIAGIYADHVGGTVEEWRERMLSETWYTDQQAVDAGLADEVLGKSDSKRARNAAAPADPAPAPEPQPDPPAPELQPEAIDWQALIDGLTEEAADVLA